ncbi:uncharacterized protein isoform X2 [Rhodnius prolixus]|uniref:uncharacterized protein isoform X2 n=1 Tax=Rhodnius prolixus TaxID=13249 RepID=UPI003D18A81F
MQRSTSIWAITNGKFLGLFSVKISKSTIVDNDLNTLKMAKCITISWLLIFITIKLNHCCVFACHKNINIPIKSNNTELLDSVVHHLSELGKRINSLEQTAWKISTKEDRWSKCYSGKCRCSQQTQTVSCWKLNLVEVPRLQTVPFDVRKIYMGQNAIQSLHKDTFLGLTLMKELMFHVSSFFFTVDARTRNCRCAVCNDKFRRSKLTDAFSIRELSDNKIDYLPEVIFENSHSLQHLKLNKNKIECLHKKLLSSTYFLETLDISHNMIEGLPEDLLTICTKLVALNLSYNKIKFIPSSFFKDLINLEEIDLSSNEILKLKNETFKGLFQLKILKLQRNQLEILESGVFSDLLLLQVFNLRQNRLTAIESGLFKNLHHLVSLDLTANWLSKLSGEEFLELHFLTELHLGHNFLTELPESAFSRMHLLQSLYLLHNKLKELRSKSFNGLISLQTLFLNNNILYRIHPQSFQPLKNLKYLQLDSNKLMNIPLHSLDYMDKLKSIKLIKNPWHCDCSVHYLSRWLSGNSDKVWPSEPTCLGPGELGGRPLDQVTHSQLCGPPWSSEYNTSSLETLFFS